MAKEFKELQSTIAENVKKLRTEKNLSQVDLAEKAGLNSLAITRIESGNFFPRPSTVHAIAKALEIDPGLILNKEHHTELPNNNQDNMTEKLMDELKQAMKKTGVLEYENEKLKAQVAKLEEQLKKLQKT